MLLVVAMLCGMCVVPVGAEDLTDEFCSLYPEYASELYDSFYWNYYKCYDGNKLTYDYDHVNWSAGMMIRSLWGFSFENVVTREDCERCKEGTYYSVYEKTLLEELVLNKFNLNLDYMVSFIERGDSFDIFEYDGRIYLSTYGVGDGPYALFVNDYNRLENGDIYASYYYAYDNGYGNSGNIYAVLKNESVAGKEIVGYRYLGTTPPSAELLAQYCGNQLNNDKNTEEVIQHDYDPTEVFHLKLDLDGDWIEDDIKVYQTKIESKHNRYDIIVEVNGKKCTSEGPGWLTGKVYIVDIDRTDKTCEILVEEAYHGAEWFQLFRYENSTLNLIKFDVDGEVYDNTVARRDAYMDSMAINGDKILYISGELTDYSTPGYPARIVRTDKYQEIERGILTKFDGEPIVNSGQTNNVKLILNTNELNLTNPAAMRNDRVMVPLREICEKIGGKVLWDGNTNTATVVCNNRTAKFVVGDTNIYVNGLGRNIDVPTQFINDSLYIPVRALTEAFSDKVEWEDPNIVKINHYKKRTYNAYLDKKKFSIEMDMSGDIPVVDAEAMCKKLGFVYKKIDSKTISIQKGDRVAIIKEGNPIYESTGTLYIGTSKANDMEGIPYMKNGKMMIPTHNICRRFDCKEYQNTYYETDSVSYNIYFSTPEKILPSYTETEEYNKFIYEKIKVDNAYVYLNDYDNDGTDEAFAFYRPKNSSSKWNCMFFDFTENNFKNESVFTDESFGDLSFKFEDIEDKKILVMCSDNDYLKLYYGFGVNEEKYIYKAGYGIADALNFNIHSENDYITTNKYDYLDGVKYDYSKNDVKIRRLLPQEEDRYWEMNIIEVSPDFIKTFKNGDEIYKIYIDKYLSRGDKVQVLYAPNATMYINYKHFDKENGRIENRYQKLWVGNSVKNKLESGGSGQGNYPKGTFWWWMPTIFIDDNDIARQYECDTEEYFEDNSTWQTETKNDNFKNLIIFFNGKKLELTREVQMNNDRTMYPFRECMEFMGAKVTWNEANQEASATLNGKTVVFKINSNHYTVNGVEKEMDVNAYIDTDATYVPIRYAAEALGYKVDWVPSVENDIIAIGDNEEVSNEIEDYVSGYKNLSSNTARIGKGLYDMIMKAPDEQFSSMRELQLMSMAAINKCERAKNNQNSILDLSTLLVDATIAVAKTSSGDVKSGVDFVAGQVTSKTAEYISDSLKENLGTASMDDIVKAMCESAYNENLKHIDTLEKYCRTIDKMDSESYTEFLMLYQCIRMNNRTLKMGVEYFSEDLSNNYLTNLAKVSKKVASKLTKDILGKGISKKIDSGFGIEYADGIFDSFTLKKLDYKTQKGILKNLMSSFFDIFADADSEALRSYGKDMKRINSDFQDMCLK